ncbi:MULTISPECIES: rhomboid-like protein [Streptomyces]|uniref:Rhomboid-like protein n=1 Tax=Streptomyces bacillaris TaxID=68179 RepID=A0ABW6E633_9ACTN|nr:rhomboid-like protein [Streptomyces nanshensis]
MSRKSPGPTADSDTDNGSDNGTGTGTGTGTGRRRSRRALSAVRRWIVTAPGTYIWLTVLFVTTVLLHRTTPAFEHGASDGSSGGPSWDPVRPLISGVLWIDGGHWLPYAVLFTVFHATAEHWLGTLRWLAVAVLAHVLAVLLGEGVLGWAVRYGDASPSAGNTAEVGVSYALAGVVAVLTYRVPHPWRYVYAFAVLVFYGVPLAADGRTVTDLGHVTAVLTGLACYRLTRGARSPGRREASSPRKRRAPSQEKTERPAAQ